MMGKYMYDCYDKDEKPLGIFFEDGTKELLEHHPDVKYVRGMYFEDMDACIEDFVKCVDPEDIGAFDYGTRRKEQDVSN